MRYLLGIYRAYWWGRHITGMYHVYTMFIACIYRSGSDIPVMYQENSLNILHGLSFVYTLYLPSIYIVYPQYIQCIYLVYINRIFFRYTMYMFGIYIVYTCYNMRINSTRWLVLRRRAGSHSTGSTSNHIRVAWTSHNFYFAGTRNKMSY